MITLELTKTEALLYMELLRNNTKEMLERIFESIDEAVTREEMAFAARENYTANLEKAAEFADELHKEVKSLRTQLDAKNLASASNVVPDVKNQEAPWGYKKDGTPKKSPGRPRGFKRG